MKKSFEKWKKVVSLIDLKEMKTRNDCEIACDCVKLANVVLHVGLCKEIFARKHTATHKPTSAHSAHMTTMTHIHLIIACGAPWPTACKFHLVQTAYCRIYAPFSPLYSNSMGGVPSSCQYSILTSGYQAILGTGSWCLQSNCTWLSSCHAEVCRSEWLCTFCS